MSLALQNKPPLTFRQIWNMSFGFLGIQFGWSLQLGNMSAIYEYLGAAPEKLAFLWLAAPLTGLIVQPVIGYMSDHTWGKFGRRRPYFFAGAVLSSVALLLMPQSSALWMAAGLLWILDSSINISMEPFRAFVADMLPPGQRTMGFAMQAFFIGLGAVFAFVLPYLLHTLWGTDQVAPAGNVIPASVRISFYAGAVVFLGTVLWTVLKTKEYPPDETVDQQQRAGKLSLTMLLQEIGQAVFRMPKVMGQLALVQFFTWLGLFFMWIYFTVAIPATCFGNPAVGSQTYIEATQWGGVCFSFYSLVTLLFSFLLPRMAHTLSRTTTHFICLLCGGIGLIAVGFITGKYWLFLSMTGVGIAWASILATPYAILSTHIPQDKMGLFMGIFNFFIVLPEMVATLCFGYILSHFLHNNKMLAVMAGGFMLILAALLTLRVSDHEKEAILQG